LLNQKLGPVVLDQPDGQNKAGSSNLPSYDDPEAGSAGAAGAATNPNVPVYDDPEAAPAGDAAQSASRPATEPSAAVGQKPAGAPASAPANADPSVPVYTDPEGK